MQEKKQNISPIKQRILHFAEYLMISKREFYTKIGVSRGTLESNTGITEDVMAKFIATYPEISVEWLITGNGSMLRESKTNHTETQKTSGLTSSKNIDNQNEDSNNNANTQENNLLITTLLERLEKQSEVIGVLKSENKQLRNQLAEKNTYHGPDAADAICADAV